jgi:hypothetical protein
MHQRFPHGSRLLPVPGLLRRSRKQRGAAGPELHSRVSSMGIEAFLANITLGDLWALQLIQGALTLMALGLIHGHQR